VSVDDVGIFTLGLAAGVVLYVVALVGFAWLIRR